MKYRFKGLRIKDKWYAPAFVECDEDGKIRAIGETVDDSSEYESVDGYAIPGLVNAHSHAFQYAMAGLNERHDTAHLKDDFWTWRHHMYQLALTIDPDQMFAIGQMLYAEMLRHGYTHVIEFHYVHHDKDGSAYNNKAELGARLVEAAKSVGIKITLIPIYYEKGGFGKAATEGQRRFISNGLDEYLKLWEASKSVCQSYKHAHIAYGIHSLRAVEPSIINECISNFTEDLPIHMHVSEQLKEIEDAISYLGKRPVQWLLDNLVLNEKYNLIHATHINETELQGLASSGANVVLCPSTEGNLGDGIFEIDRYQAKGGSWCIGTDSHVGINPFEELRMLDYRRRAITHQRTILVKPQSGDAGLNAFDMAWRAGYRSAGITKTDYFEVGQYFDALIVDADAPLVGASSIDSLMSSIVYSSDSSYHLGTIASGKWQVQQSKHVNHLEINKNFKSAINQLSIR